MERQQKLNLVYAIIAVFGILLFHELWVQQQTIQPVAYSTFEEQLKAGNVAELTIKEKYIFGKLNSPDENGKSVIVANRVDPKLVEYLSQYNVPYTQVHESRFLATLLSWLIPALIFLGIWLFIFRKFAQNQGVGGGFMSIGKSKAKVYMEKETGNSFKDVAGVDESKAELIEIVDFLKSPEKYSRIGARMPKGVLLVGPPGTGKTLLARAVAGEAGVPFFSISGSEFVEMFVGVGAARVRDLFEQAGKSAPAIIFIDELDALGRARGSGAFGGNDEREQTLNQLLVEMDGFEGHEGIIMIAATNRPDVLDPALLRPGRFDRQVVVPLPDLKGREQILGVHMKKIPVDESVDARVIARGTPGFSGADLANLVNEAALFAAREDCKAVTQEHFDRAKDKIMMGAERKSMVMSEDDKRLTAYHEAGHAIVGRIVPEHDPVYKVTIIPRGRALGVTMFLPEEDKYSLNKTQIESQLASLFGGRVAEELIYGKAKVTTGASNDIERATAIARNMVSKWGLSDVLGPLSYDENEDEVFLGRSVTQHKNVSDETHRLIDKEVRKIIDGAYTRAREILTEYDQQLHLMADALMQYETIDARQIDQIMDGNEPDPPAGWDDKPPRSPGPDDSGDAAEASGSPATGET